MTAHPWIFEPCDPENEKDAYDRPWEHAVRGARPNGTRSPAIVTGYGHTEDRAQQDARDKAEVYDAQEVLRRLTPPPIIDVTACIENARRGDKC